MIEIAGTGPVYPRMQRVFYRGDSHTEGDGWRNMFMARFPNAQHFERAISAGTESDWGKIALADVIEPGDWSLILPGFNYLRTSGEDPEKLEAYRLLLAANVAWCCLPDANKRRASTYSRTGAWQTIPVTEYAFGIMSGNAGDTVTIPGPVDYLIGMSSTSGAGSFTANGKPFTCNRTVGSSALSPADTFAPALFPVYSEGPVTVRVTGDGLVFLLWDGHAKDATANAVLGNTLKMSAAGAALAAPSNQYTPNGQQLYSQVAADVAAMFRRDGVTVLSADPASAYDPETQGHADLIHMEFEGHQAVDQAFADAINLRRELAVLSQADLRVQSIAFDPLRIIMGSPLQV